MRIRGVKTVALEYYGVHEHRRIAEAIMQAVRAGSSRQEAWLAACRAAEVLASLRNEDVEELSRCWCSTQQADVNKHLCGNPRCEAMTLCK